MPSLCEPAHGREAASLRQDAHIPQVRDSSVPSVEPCSALPEPLFAQCILGDSGMYPALHMAFLPLPIAFVAKTRQGICVSGGYSYLY